MTSTANLAANRVSTGTGGGLSRADRRGRAAGAVVLALFALAWTSWGLSAGVPRPLATLVTVTAVVCSLACLGGVLVAYRRSAGAPVARDASFDRAVVRRFGTVVTAEFVGLAVAARILTSAGHHQWVPAVVCLGVGVHFLPLSHLFGVPLYRWTGAALCLTAVATPVLAAATGRTALWTLLPGLGAALTLYLTSAQLIRVANATPSQQPRR